MPGEGVDATVSAVQEAASGVRAYGDAVAAVTQEARQELSRLAGEFSMAVVASQRALLAAERAQGGESSSEESRRARARLDAARRTHDANKAAERAFERAAGDLRGALGAAEGGALSRLRSAHGGIAEYVEVLATYRRQAVG